MATSRIAEALGNWAGANGALYAQLAAAVRQALVSGDMLPGERLPPERLLAKELSVSRSTVLAAYRVLKADGWLESRQGSGTWLTRPGLMTDRDPGSPDPARSLQGNAFLRRGGRTPIDFATAALPAAAAVEEEARATVASDLPGLLAGYGYLPGGLRELRRAVAARFTSEGVATDEVQVLITNGNQQAITLAASLTLVPGGIAFIENPSSPGVLDAFRGAHADIRPIQVVAAGIDVDVLEGLARRYPPRAIYLTPTFQSPTGAVMPVRWRQRVAKLAIDLQTILIEDLGPASLALGHGRPPPSLAVYAPDHTITIGSMSKLFWAGLRTGWIRGPAHLVGRAGRLKAAADLGSPLISQMISARLLARHDEVRQARREYLLPRLERMVNRLEDLLPDWTYARPAGGLVLWVRLPRGNAAAFAQVASRHGVVFVPGSLLSVDQGYQDHLRLAFGLGRAEIDEGVSRLAAAWAEYEPHADPEPALIGGLT